MLRLETDHGWWLITHPDHARLAGEFAAAWGNQQFRAPEPREHALFGIRSHDDGWAARDAAPATTRQGKPSAFSIELVGKYSAFEEIDLADYLAVRERAVRIIAEQDAYAALLIAKHTYNLLTAHADRSTIQPEGLVLLDAFLEKQLAYQQELYAAIAEENKQPERMEENFRLLQACDNLSLLSCVAYDKPATLLHALACNDSSAHEVAVVPLAPRHFRLTPWPFAERNLQFQIPARHVRGKIFASSEELAELFHAAPVERLTIELSA